MPDADSLPTIPCPSCRSPMKTEALERHSGGFVQVELCFACSGFWFDRMASVELAPTAVMQLFKQINGHQDVQQQPIAGHLNCPRCNQGLVLNFDLVKSGRFSYYRCQRGDGRFTPFFQFLREKQFVRTLTAGEVQKLRAEVRQVNCSQCGAPIDLDAGTECQYCHASVSLLDPDAVTKAVQLWSDAESRRHQTPGQQIPSRAPHTALPALDLLSGLRTRTSASPGTAVDLVAMGIGALGALFLDSL